MTTDRTGRIRLNASPLRVTAAPLPGHDRLKADVAVDLVAAPAGEGEEPRQPTFKINAYNGGAMRPASPWLPAPLVIDLASARAVDGVVALLDHYPDQIVGQGVAEISTSGIVIEGKVTGDVDDKSEPAAKVVAHAKRGFKWKASLDASIGRLEKVEAGERVTVNGRDFVGPIYIARATTIEGVSFVSIAADKSTSAAVAATEGTADMDFHAWLKAGGFDPATLSDQQRDTLLKQYQAEQAVRAGGAGGAGGGTGAASTAGAGGSAAAGGAAANLAAGAAPDAEAVFAQAKAKQARRSAITAECQRLVEAHPDKIEIIQAASSQAFTEDWTAERFQLWAYRELPSNVMVDNRPRAGRGQVDARVVEAGVARMIGLQGLDKLYDARTLEASEKQYRTGVGLVELLMIAARANGVGDISSRDPHALLRAAFPPEGLRAGPVSSFDVSGILSNVGNKSIVQHFNAVDNAWASIAATRPVSDFKQITSYSLTGDMQYEEVAPGGQLKHGTAGEESYTNQAKTYGRMFGIDRRDIINDDLGAFNGVTRRIGRGGALKLNDVFWTRFLNNSAFFTTGRGNLDEGADTAFSIDSLTLAEILFMNQTDPDGKPIGIMPKLLVVPPALYRSALQVLNSSAVVISGDTDRTLGSTNTFQGNFKPVTSPYMSNAAYSGSSSKKWYLLGDPNDMAVIEVAFLNGVQRPTVESAQADFNQLGIQFRGYFDFGVGFQEYRGGVAMKGEV